MRRINHLKGLIENIKKTEEIIALHKQSDDLKIMSTQYEALKAKQVAQLIDELAMPPFQTVESFSIIKLVINKYYPSINSYSSAKGFKRIGFDYLIDQIVAFSLRPHLPNPIFSQ